MRRIVVICGPSGGGKSTHSQGYASLTGARQLSLAQYLKDEAMKLGWNGVKDIAGRRFLQELQYKLKDQHGEDVFVRKLVDKADKIFRNTKADTVVVDDHRFAVERAGFLAWKSRSKSRIVTFVKFEDQTAEERWEQAFLRCEPWAMHVSELEWRAFPDSAFDAKYVNDRTCGLATSIANFNRNVDTGKR